MTTTLEQAKARIEQLEDEFGPDHEFLADALLDYAKILRQNNALLEAVNIEAKAKVIKSRFSFGDENSLTPPVEQSAETQLEPVASDTKACPFCAETIKASAIKCRFCGSDLAKSGTAEKSEGKTSLVLPVLLCAIILLVTISVAWPTIISSLNQSALYSKYPVGSSYQLSNSNEDIIWFFDSPSHAAEYLRARQINDAAAVAELDKNSLFAISENGIAVRVIDDEYAGQNGGALLKIRVEKAQEYSFLNGKSGWVLVQQFERKAKPSS